MLSGLNAGNQGTPSSPRRVSVSCFNAVRLERRKSGRRDEATLRHAELLQCCPA